MEATTTHAAQQPTGGHDGSDSSRVEADPAQLGSASRLLDAWPQQSIGTAMVALAVLGAVAALLRPSWLALGYMFVLVGAAVVALRSLDAARTSATSLLRHLDQLADALHRGEEDDLLGSWRTGRPQERQLVGLLRSVASRQAVPRGSIADDLLEPEHASLAFAGFMRSALVLGGLFGTVFFFAFDLNSVPEGATTDLLTNLRGAMACTLTGILASVTVGYLLNSLQSSLGRVGQAATTLLSGPVLLSQDEAVAEKESAISDQWSYVIAELRQLREDGVDQLKRMGDDAAAYAVALRKVEEKLRSIPQLKLSSDVKRMGDLVNMFGASIQTMAAASDTLATAAVQLGAVIPREVLARVGSIAEAQNRHIGTITEQHEKVTGGIGALSHQMDEIAKKLTIQQAIGELAHAIATSEAAIRSELDGHSEASRSAHARIEGAIAAGTANWKQLKAAATSLAESANRLEPLPAKLVEPIKGIEGVAAVLRVSQETLREQGTKIEQKTADLSGATDKLSRKADEIGGASEAVTRIGTGMRRLEEMLRPVYEWHRHARIAPLMRFLLMPLRRRDVARLTDSL